MGNSLSFTTFPRTQKTFWCHALQLWGNPMKSGFPRLERTVSNIRQERNTAFDAWATMRDKASLLNFQLTKLSVSCISKNVPGKMWNFGRYLQSSLKIQPRFPGCSVIALPRRTRVRDSGSTAGVHLVVQTCCEASRWGPCVCRREAPEVQSFRGNDCVTLPKNHSILSWVHPKQCWKMMARGKDKHVQQGFREIESINSGS